MSDHVANMSQAVSKAMNVLAVNNRNYPKEALFEEYKSPSNSTLCSRFHSSASCKKIMEAARPIFGDEQFAVVKRDLERDGNSWVLPVEKSKTEEKPSAGSHLVPVAQNRRTWLDIPRQEYTCHATSMKFRRRECRLQRLIQNFGSLPFLGFTFSMRKNTNTS
jgi:hypothetical protein